MNAVVVWKRRKKKKNCSLCLGVDVGRGEGKK